MAKHAAPRPAVQKAAGRTARRAPLALIVALVGILAVGGTAAWLATSTNEVKNTFEPTEVTCAVSETFENNVKSNVKVTNTGDVDAYVRAAVVINWVDAEGKVVAQVPEEYGYALTGSLPASSKWVKGADGFYYYAEAVAPGASTVENLIDSIAPTFEGTGEQTCFLSVDILAGAIQAEPDAAFNESWGASSGLMASNGKLTAKTA